MLSQGVQRRPLSGIPRRGAKDFAGVSVVSEGQRESSEARCLTDVVQVLLWREAGPNDPI